MDLAKISSGKKFPEEINVVIEIPQNSVGIKYEVDKESGAVFVDRFLSTSMFYPANYGFVPNTLSDDGDPADVLVISEYQIHPGCVIPARPVGVLITKDEKGYDEKIIAVPASGVSANYNSIKDIQDVCPAMLDKIKHFFEHYKDLEKGKFVKVEKFENAAKAKEILQNAHARCKS